MPETPKFRCTRRRLFYIVCPAARKHKAAICTYALYRTRDGPLGRSPRGPGKDGRPRPAMTRHHGIYNRYGTLGALSTDGTHNSLGLVSLRTLFPTMLLATDCAAPGVRGLLLPQLAQRLA